jgi:hypothetical protein
MADEKPGLPPEIVAELRAKYGDVIEVETREGPFAFRVPNRSEYNRYTEKLFNEKTRHLASDFLVRACCVYPPDADARIERRPGVVTTCASPVIEHAGVDTEARAKNLSGD